MKPIGEGKALRILSYAFWTAGGAMVPLALDRLVIHPALNVHFGAELFGAFLWVLGIVNLVGSASADGFAMLLMRDLSRQDSGSARRMLRTAVVLNSGFSVAIVVCVLAVSLFFAAAAVRSHALSIYLPLGLLAVFRATFLIMLANMRIRRRFRTIFFLGVMEASVLAMVLVAAPTASFWLVGTVYAASAALTAAVAWRLTGEFRGSLRRPEQWFDAEWSRWFLQGWVAAATLNVLNGSQLYLGRVVLGAMADVTEVAILYAGTAMGNLFILPVTVISALVFSLLGGRADNGLSGGERRAYLVVSVLAAVGVGVAVWHGGSWLVSNRYPDLAGRTLAFFHWIAIGNGLLSLVFLVRPLAMKYGGLNHVVGVATICFGIQFAALLVLIPIAGAEGAAIGQMLGSGTAAIAWVWISIWPPRGMKSSPAS